VNCYLHSVIVLSGYSETSIDELTKALYHSLGSYDQQPNFVFFKEAVEHAARLSRVLVAPLFVTRLYHVI